MRHIFLVFCSLFTFNSWAQMSDSFDDGDFTNNPTWTGDVSDFIVNANNELQLNAPSAGESYLSTPHNLTQLSEREWRFKIKYDFSPSASNKGETYLTAADADLSTAPDGIFMEIGENGSNDPIYLKERIGGTETTILTSTPALVASSFEISVKIILNATNDWELFVDDAGGTAYQLDATANYPPNLVGQYLGVNLSYSATRADKFYFDDIYAGPIQVDNIPPNLSSVTAISANEVEVLFDESIVQTSGENTANYSVDNGIGSPTSVQQDASNTAL